MDYKWIENDLFLLFIVVLQNEDRQSFFENRLATFNFDKMEWREIHIGNLCRGDISLNPYRMQITPDKRLFLLNPRFVVQISIKFKLFQSRTSLYDIRSSFLYSKEASFMESAIFSHVERD